MHYTSHSISGASLKGPLEELAPCAQQVKELHLFLKVSPLRLVGFLALHFPNVVRLYLRLFGSNHLEDGDLRSQVEVHRLLREFDIGFNLNKGRPFPRENCRKALERLTEVCPVMEVVRFGALLPVEGGGIDEREISLDLLMDMRRTTEGEWQERSRSEYECDRANLKSVACYMVCR